MACNGLHSVEERCSRWLLLTHSRGQMTVIDREGLEGSSCECYAILRAEFDRLLG